jgi:hypothetical protein
MTGMALLRSQERLVAIVAGLAFFLCQSIALAHSCLTVTAGSGEAAVQQPPCHGTRDEPGSSAPSSAQSGCHYISSALPDVPVYSVLETPALTVHAVEVASVPASIFESPSLLVKPPTYSILHCCLRT